MPRLWRKGCFCGCLYEAECAYYEPPAQRVEHVHIVHHVHHEAPREIQRVESEVTIVREIP